MLQTSVFTVDQEAKLVLEHAARAEPSFLNQSSKPFVQFAGKQRGVHLKGISAARRVVTNNPVFSVVLTVFRFSANSRQVLCLWTPHNGNGKRAKLLTVGYLFDVFWIVLCETLCFFPCQTIVVSIIVKVIFQIEAVS